MYRSPAGKILYKLFKEKDNEFQFHLERLIHSINEEDIHYLRRASKRIKALYKLFQQIDPEFQARKKFSIISSLFESAGQLREIQINQHTLFSYKPSKELIEFYAQFTQDNKSQCINSLSDAISSFDLKKQKKTLKEIKKICQNTSRKKLVNSSITIIQSKLSGVKKIIMAGDSGTQVHDSRILLKQLSPSLSILEIIQHEGFDKEMINLFRSIEDKMGYWHDRFVLQQSLRHMIENMRMEKTLKDETDLLLEKIAVENQTHLIKIEKKLWLAIERFNAIS